MKNKSAKDIAFEKERAKYRKQIRELETELKQSRLETIELRDRLEESEQKRLELQDWIDRLLEYIDMPEEVMRREIEKVKIRDGISERMEILFGMRQLFRY